MARASTSTSTANGGKRKRDVTKTTSTASTKRSKVSDKNDPKSSVTRPKVKQSGKVHWKEGDDAAPIASLDDGSDASSSSSEDNFDSPDEDEKDEDELNEPEIGDESSARFSVRPHREFVSERGKDRLLSLRILNHFDLQADPDYLETASIHTGAVPVHNAYDFMRKRQEAQGGDPALKLWKASIRAHNFGAFNAPLCLSAVGALLEHLVRLEAATDLEKHDVGGLDVRGIEMVALDQVMQINSDALYSLQVFASESHASMHSDRTKEGLSLFGILDHTRTRLGRALLKQWLLRPSLDLEVITSRHDALSCFLSADNQAAVDAMQTHLKGIKNIPRALATLRGGRGGLKEWTSLVKFTFHTIMLREAVGELCSANDLDIVQKVLVSVLKVATFNEMGSVVNETIDWEASMNEGRVCVRHGIDLELDEKKKVYDGLSTFLAKVALRVANSIPEDISNQLDVVYLPQLGYLITIPIREDWIDQADVPVVEGWQFQFSTDQQVYFKNQDMQDLDVHIGDLRSIITAFADREIEIIHALQERVMQYGDSMKASCDACSELDSLLSLTTASRIYGFVRPQMATENVLEVINGRHPLQELCVDTFVPNNLHIFGGLGTNAVYCSAGSDTEEFQEENSQRIKKRSVVICTGPNACGKSVYLKQNALIPLMAQIGCFVPADAATIGIVDRIFTRIETHESVGKTQSAFMIDLAQVSLALRNCTERSLLILDEFGKGTLPSDGAGFLCGAIHHLLSRGKACPKVLATTHFHEIFSNNLLDMTLPISFVHMRVILPTNPEEVFDSEAGGDDEETATRKALEHFTFLYSVAPGLSLSSQAAHCALLNGVTPRVVRRAVHVTELLLNHELTTLLDEKMTELEEKELEEAEQVTRRFCSLDLDPGHDHAGVRERLAAVLGRTIE
ncbi:MutS protein msh5 [Tulasnella sp. 332]|nr:MutS protein msh5 [Tulasnella sp. 332]